MSPIQTSEDSTSLLSENLQHPVTIHVDNRCLILGTYLKGWKCTTVKSKTKG